MSSTGILGCFKHSLSANVVAMLLPMFAAFFVFVEQFDMFARERAYEYASQVN